MTTYLPALTERVAQGLACLPEDHRARHVGYLCSAQHADGGFAGRLGGSDLYYTAFALRSLAVLGALTADVAGRAGQFLRQSLSREASVVDFFSLLYSCRLIGQLGGPDVLGESRADWRDRVAGTLDTFQAPDGGYGKTPGGTLGSTYHTFLVALCFELLDRPLPQAGQVAAFIDSRRRPDGGFVEVPPMQRSGTNPTAAAVGVLQVLGNLPGELIDLVTGFLLQMQAPEGGLRANGRIPFADLLSTFTGAWTLHRLGNLERLAPGPVLAYVRSLEMPDGGFRGHQWDDQRDTEYTFYGLGTLALFSET